MVSNSFDYYDAIEDRITYELFNEIAWDNFELQQWLVEDGLIYFSEAADAGQAHQQWKINTTTQLKNTLTRFGQFALQQLAKDLPFLKTSQMVILNTKQFPPKDNLSMKNAPNYLAAINRISTPITTHLNSINLSQIDTNGKNPKVNLQIKKSLIPSYDGKTDYKQYCKNYFYGGEGKRMNLSSSQCGQLLPIAFQFCSTYESRLKSLQTEIMALVSYINTDTNYGSIKQETEGDLKRLQTMQQQQKSQTPGMASNNPAANNAGNVQQVNASAEYEHFMTYYFNDLLHEANPQQPITNNPTISGNKGVNPTQAVTKSKAPAGAQVNSKALSYKRKQVAADVAIDAFTAKITAFGMLYHDFIYLLRSHVASYKGAVHANMGRVQNNMAPPQQNQNMNPQQQMKQQ